MTLLLAIESGGDSWSAERWRSHFADALPGRRIVVHGADAYRPGDVRFAAVWKPPHGLLATLPRLEVMFNLGAGVDALLADLSLPAVPLVRVINADLAQRMTEYVTLHVLLHHRRLPTLIHAQSLCQWAPKTQWAASAVRVGILGFGALGQDAGEVLVRLGFKVAGFTRSPKYDASRPPDGIEMFAGAARLPAFLARTDILVVLTPLTSETRGMLDRRLFSQLARDGVLGAPVLINAGRGGLQVEADILACLDDGTLGAASLDVFEREPLPVDSPLWTHPNVIVTPHNAADSDPASIALDIAGQIIDYERGGKLQHTVQRELGY